MGTLEWYCAQRASIQELALSGNSRPTLREHWEPGNKRCAVAPTAPPQRTVQRSNRSYGSSKVAETAVEELCCLPTPQGRISLPLSATEPTMLCPRTGASVYSLDSIAALTLPKPNKEPIWGSQQNTAEEDNSTNVACISFVCTVIFLLPLLGFNM